MKMYFDNWNPPTSDNFRSLIEFDNGVPASFGCSFTEGVGVYADQTFSFLLNVANCGLNGASNDKICRTAIEYCNKYSPKEIYVMWTFKNRREVIDDTGTFLKFKAFDPGSKKYRWHKASAELSNDYSDEYNYQKNRLLLNSFCELKNINLYSTDVDCIENDKLGSDNAHPGVEWHEKVYNLFKKLNDYTATELS